MAMIDSETVQTQAGAQTMALDPKTHHVTAAGRLRR
jgi:hypothetical protein